jgi:hypothetical protein
LIADEGIGHNKCNRVFLLSERTAAAIFLNQRTLGDARLVPVYPQDSAEAEFMAAVTTRMKAIVKRRIATSGS